MAEVIAISALLYKAAEFVPQLRDGLYKGSAELEEFPIKVAILRAKHAQWTRQLQKFGMTEDEDLKPLIKEAIQILDKEQAYVTRLQKSRFMRLKRRAFPGKLTSILSSLVDIVNASPELLEKRVERNDLLMRSLAQTPCPLPFPPDPKYVPLSGSITEVQKALEDADGPYVVTLHGGPGMGKSTMVKYLAIHYQQLRRQQMVSGEPTPFPDGVFYLFCGRGAQNKVKQLQVNLLESLGGGFGSPTQSNGGTSGPEEEGEYLHLPSYETKLRFCLAERKLLVILDDVWEVDILEKLLVPGASVKYLVTSQIRTICSDATLIELKTPNKEEARKILANYTEGLPTKGEFPKDIQRVTDAVIHKLDYHPLSLANIGTAINRRRAIDPAEWEAVNDGLQDHLEDSNFHNNQLVYGTRYSLTVGASMMLMVDSLSPDARHLLFLMGLLTGPQIPEVVVKFFLNEIERTGMRYKYRRDIKYLEDRSLVEYRAYVPDEAHTSRFVLVTHGLRSYYIRRNHTEDMNCIATQIVSGGSGITNDRAGQLVQSACTNKALATIMSAMYLEKPFRDAVATHLESQSRTFNAAFIPRNVNYDVDALDLMRKARRLDKGLESLVWLLNPDGVGGWKQQAHDYAKKIVIRLIFRNELDDESMADLIRLPQTTAGACVALSNIVYHLMDALEHAFVDQNITFSSAHGQTMKSLNEMCSLHYNVETPNQCPAVVGVLGDVLLYESDDTILSIAKKWMEFLAKDSNPRLQMAVASAIRVMKLSKALILVGEFPGVMDHLLMLTVEGRNSYVRMGAVETISHLCQSSSMASKIAAIPGALEILFKKYLFQDHEQYSSRKKYSAAIALSMLSCIPENSVKFATVPDGLQGLTNMLTSSPNSRSLQKDELLADIPGLAAKILGNLARTNEVRKSILTTFFEGKEGLQLLQISLLPENCPVRELRKISRVMTILDPLQASPKITSRVPLPWASYKVHMGRARAYLEMQMYLEALAALNIAHEYFKKVPLEQQKFSWWIGMSCFRYRIFVKAMLEDYDGAMLEVNSALYYYQKNSAVLVERGVLKRLAGVDLEEALADLDEALKLIYKYDMERRYSCLKHRGLVKLMMGDEVGARADAEAALKLKFRYLVFERADNALGPRTLSELPVNYLGFSL